MKKSLITMLVALVLVAAVGVGATLAYLSDKTGTVTNTFTVGKVKIDLTEFKDGVELADNQTGFSYENVIPGQSYSKEPVVTVLAKSEECYLFVKLVNANGDKLQLNDYTLNENGGWAALDGVADVYYRVVPKSEADTAFTLFKSFTVNKNIVNEQNENTTFTDIAISAYAVQKAGFASVAEAWTAAQQ